jgi:hypothetical protein
MKHAALTGALVGAFVICVQASAGVGRLWTAYPTLRVRKEKIEFLKERLSVDRLGERLSELEAMVLAERDQDGLRVLTMAMVPALPGEVDSFLARAIGKDKGDRSLFFIEVAQARDSRLVVGGCFAGLGW